MTARSPLPKICIALGLPDPQRLLEHARREAEAGERFLEFRLDYLPRPEDGLAVIREFLKGYPDATILATCRRHHRYGRGRYSRCGKNVLGFALWRAWEQAEA